MKTFIVACGGTGGHLSPGIAVAEELIQHGHKCILIISNKEIDKTLAKNYPQISFLRFPGIAFSKKPHLWIRCMIEVIKNFCKSLKLIRSISADAVIGFGGFTNVGIILAATCLRKPCFLHEANRIIGKANRLLSTFATRFYLPEGALLKNIFPVHLSYLGFPLRKEIIKIDKKEARKHLHLPQHQSLVLVTGGSQGAQALNQWCVDHCELLNAYGINVICLTGLKQTQSRNLYLDSNAHVQFLPFSNDMNILYSAADLVICRAGAGTIAEIIRCETPAILVPYPHAADNHQYVNASFFTQQSGCLMVEQSKLHTLFDEILQLLNNPSMLNHISCNLRQLNQDDYTRLLVQDIEKVLQSREE